MKESIRILSTKKLKPNQRQFLLNAGFSVVEVDFIEIEHYNDSISGVNENLIFTSSNAVKSILPIQDRLAGKPCFCVGTKTKKLLEEHGFKVVATSENAEALAMKIIDFPHEKFTFFTGNLKMENLPAILRNGKIEFNEVEVYKTVLSPKEVKSKPNAVLFFSPSAVESFLAKNNISNEICFCIGKTTAKALENITSNILIASQPTIENVIIKTINHFKKA
jgi:uroporphyrinogen-III synthase